MRRIEFRVGFVQFSASCVAFVHQRLVTANLIPVPIIVKHLGLAVRRFLEYLKCLTRLWVFKKLGGGDPRLLVNLREEAKPQHLHLPLGEVLRHELRQFDEHEVQTFEDLSAVLAVDHPVVVVVPLHVRLEHLVDEVECIDGLE